MAELRERDTTLRDRMVDLIAGLAGGDRAGYGTAHDVMRFLDWTPVGVAPFAYDVGQDLAAGNMGEGLFGAGLLGLPAAGKVVGPAKKFVSELRFSKGSVEDEISGAVLKNLDEGVLASNFPEGPTPQTVDELAASLNKLDETYASLGSDAVTGNPTIDAMISAGDDYELVSNKLNGMYNTDEIADDEYLEVAKKLEEAFGQSPVTKLDEPLVVTGFPNIDDLLTKEMKGQGGGGLAIYELGEQFKAGKITQEQYLKGMDDVWAYTGNPLSGKKNSLDQVPFVTGNPEIDKLIEPGLHHFGTQHPAYKKIIEMANTDFSATPGEHLALLQKIYAYSDNNKVTYAASLPAPVAEVTPKTGSVPWMTPPMRLDNAVPAAPQVSEELLAGLGMSPQVLYHGSNKKFDEMGDPGEIKSWERAFFLSDKPQVSLSYGNNLYPVHARMENPFEIDAKGAHYGDFGEEAGPIVNFGGMDSRPSMHGMIEGARRAGHDSLIIKNMSDVGGSGQTQYLIFGPDQVRSVWAKFDPAKKHLANLMAGLGGAAVVPPFLSDEALLGGPAAEEDPSTVQY